MAISKADVKGMMDRVNDAMHSNGKLQNVKVGYSNGKCNIYEIGTSGSTNSLLLAAQTKTEAYNHLYMMARVLEMD